MTLRTVAREIKDYPATACLSLSWVVVFLVMTATWLRNDPAPSWGRFLVLGIGESHRFGDLTLRELFQGEVWRLITCNFVHLSILHIALNLVGFYILGTILESWYGTPQFLFIYVMTGGLGNLISGLFRYMIGSNPNSQSAGGSVVIMGLVGLFAMVGWKSRTSQGSELRKQMVKAIGLMALLSIALIPLHRYIRIDNWGHAGGAVVGGIAGLFHLLFLRLYHRPAAWTMGLTAIAVIVGSGVAQVVADRREAPARQERQEKMELLERLRLDAANRALRIVSLLGERRLDPRVVIQAFQIPENRMVLSGGVTAQSYHGALMIAQTALTRSLTDEEQAEFDRCAGQISGLILTNLESLLRRESTQADFDRVKALAAVAETRKLTDEENDQFKARLASIKALVQQELEERVRQHWHDQRTQARNQVESR